MAALTAERAQELLALDADTGVLRWRIPRRGRWEGCIAGAKHRSGYWSLCLDGARYQAHRVIWLMVHGKWPEGFLDHINGDKADNRLCNLREATPSQNTSNRGGVRGVTLHRGGKYQAQIKHLGRSHYLGLFASSAEAEAAYREASRRLHGEFGARA